MNGPRASNPSAAAAGPAKGAATKSGKESTSGAASPASSYAERNRQEDPVPVADGKAKVPVVLSSCQFLSKPPALAIEKDFEVSCQATWSGDQAPESLRVTFKIAMKWDEAGTPKEEEALEELEAHLDASKPEQTVTAKGTLPRPPSFPADGTKVSYRAVASHPAAASTSQSDAVELVLRERVHYAEVPDILFAHGGHFPCLDEKGWLLDALAASIDFAKEQGKKQQLVVFGHADTSGDHPINYDISERRARAALALATREDAVWEDLAKQHRKIEEIQRCLKTLSVAHGWSCDPGAIDDQDGPKTQAAVKAFQNRGNDAYKLGLTPDGVAGPKTWKAMHRVVCGLVAQKLGVADPGDASYPSWDKPDLGYPQGKGAYGCGESFPVDRAEVDGLRSEANRRVDFLFGSGWNFLAPPPDRKRPLTKGECPTYDRAVTEWVAIKSEPGSSEELRVKLWLGYSTSLAGVSVKVSNPDGSVDELVADGNGEILFPKKREGHVRMEIFIDSGVRHRNLCLSPAGLSTDQGIWDRLTNLGYAPVESTGSFEADDLASAVQNFQLEHSLAPTSMIDELTRSELDDVYKSAISGLGSKLPEYHPGIPEHSKSKVS